MNNAFFGIAAIYCVLIGATVSDHQQTRSHGITYGNLLTQPSPSGCWSDVTVASDTTGTSPVDSLTLSGVRHNTPDNYTMISDMTIAVARTFASNAGWWLVDGNSGAVLAAGYLPGAGEDQSYTWSTPLVLCHDGDNPPVMKFGRLTLRPVPGQPIYPQEGTALIADVAVSLSGRYVRALP